MNILCTLGSHKWKACKCLNCGKTRNEQHDWSKDCEKCADCGAVRESSHQWTGCKCSNCSRVRDESHDWKNGRCTRCEAKAPSLMRAAGSGAPGEIRSLIASGADPNEAGRNGVTALMHAARSGRARCVEALLEAGANIHSKDAAGHTALFHAAILGKNLGCVKALINAGADVNASMTTTINHKTYYLSSEVAEINAVIKAARESGNRSQRATSQKSTVSRGAPAVLSELMNQDCFLLPTGDGLAKSDDPTQEFSGGAHQGVITLLIN